MYQESELLHPLRLPPLCGRLASPGVFLFEISFCLLLSSKFSFMKMMYGRVVVAAPPSSDHHRSGFFRRAVCLLPRPRMPYPVTSSSITMVFSLPTFFPSFIWPSPAPSFFYSMVLVFWVGLSSLSPFFLSIFLTNPVGPIRRLVGCRRHFIVRNLGALTPRPSSSPPDDGSGLLLPVPPFFRLSTSSCDGGGFRGLPLRQHCNGPFFHRQNARPGLSPPPPCPSLGRTTGVEMSSRGKSRVPVTA